MERVVDAGTASATNAQHSRVFQTMKSWHNSETLRLLKAAQIPSNPSKMTIELLCIFANCMHTLLRLNFEQIRLSEACLLNHDLQRA